MYDQILCISYFDAILGPNVLYSNAPLDNSEHPDIGRILEFNEAEGSFIFAFRKYQTLNYIFYIDSPLARGGKDLLMITYMVRSSFFRNEIVDVFNFLESKTPILEEYATELGRIEGLPEALQSNRNYHAKPTEIKSGTPEFQKVFLDLYDGFLKKITPEFSVSTPLKSTKPLKKIFILGANHAGKTTFLKNIETIQFHNQDNLDLPNQIYEIIVDNLQILTFDCIERDFDCNMCNNIGGCIKNAQGFIVLIDVSDKDSIEETRSKFHHILEKLITSDKSEAPILIIGNKKNDINVIEEEKILNRFEYKRLKNNNIKVKYYPIHILEDDVGNMKSLRWLVRHMV